ncbi:helix-turn-helix domain-containing protein [Streptomyces sp. C10-9-1]|uniref:helix-turn-helix domain-containing protein n=1 Tax=Streptomyces sp. C10-9-1 TaxID=1859285 RepID=UPI003F49E643
MSDSPRHSRPAVPYGPTARSVAANVRRLRGCRGFSIYQLSSALIESGRPIGPSAVAKIERQERQVTVDELIALALALGVSPSALLMPFVEAEHDLVEVSGGGGPVPAGDAWAWADGRRPLRLTPGLEPTERLEHQLYGRPQWMWRQGA